LIPTTLSLCFVLRYVPLFISRALLGEGYFYRIYICCPFVLNSLVTLLHDNAFRYWGGSFLIWNVFSSGFIVRDSLMHAFTYFKIYHVCVGLGTVVSDFVKSVQFQCSDNSSLVHSFWQQLPMYLSIMTGRCSWGTCCEVILKDGYWRQKFWKG